MEYDFRGWATKNDLKCSDGRIIRKDAFKHCDGLKVPLVWNHDHTNLDRVIGHAYLENRDEGVYTYGSFNDTKLGNYAKVCVAHGDLDKLSIYANQLQQQGPNVMHGMIREVSLVLAGANPGAYIESVMVHGEESEEEAIIHTGEHIEIHDNYLEDDSADNKEEGAMTHSEEDKGPTMEEIYDGMDEDQKNFVHIMVGLAAEGVDDEKEVDEDDEDDEGGSEDMKHNLFDKATDTGANTNNVLSHADQEAILALAKSTGVGSFRDACKIFMSENSHLMHGFEEGEEGIDSLFPDFKNLNPGAPDILRPDQSWVMSVINKISKSPYSRVRTRHADARIADLRAKGYQKKGDQKKLTNTIKLLGRSFEPQTIYVKDEVHRDDIIDITDFSYVDFVLKLMKENMYETLALAALVGDGRDEADADKIHDERVCPVWKDDELYTIHKVIDIEAARAEIQGTDTNVHFGENYIYAETIIRDMLYAREQYKGTGTPDMYCAPHLVNVMLLARDLNGRRIYDSKADLAKALNVNSIVEIEQLEGRTRVDDEGKTRKLLGLVVNLSDYQFGSTRGGELTKFEDFDIDFNKHKYLLETRISGGLTIPYAAIALEEITEVAAG